MEAELHVECPVYGRLVRELLEGLGYQVTMIDQDLAFKPALFIDEKEIRCMGFYNIEKFLG